MDIEFFKIQVKSRDFRRILLCLREEDPQNRMKYVNMIPEGMLKNSVLEVCETTKSIQKCIDELDNARISSIERMYESMGC